MKKMLILISGPPGSGKSTLSKAIARKKKLVHLDKDCIDEPFSPGDRGKKYTQEIEPKVIEALINLARLNLSNGLSCIVDLPWSHVILNQSSYIIKLKNLLKSESSRLKVIELDIPQEVLKKRIQARNLKRDEGKLNEKGWQNFIKTDRVGELIPIDHYLVNANKKLDQYIDGVLEYLDGSDETIL